MIQHTGLAIRFNGNHKRPISNQFIHEFLLNNNFIVTIEVKGQYCSVLYIKKNTQGKIVKLKSQGLFSHILEVNKHGELGILIDYLIPSTKHKAYVDDEELGEVSTIDEFNKFFDCVF